MPLTQQQIRDRRFSMGGMALLKKFLSSQIQSLLDSFKEIKELVTKTSDKTFKVIVKNPVKNDKDYTKSFKGIVNQLEVIKGALQTIEKKKPIKVEQREVDFKIVLEKLVDVEEAIDGIDIPSVKFDPVIKQLRAVQKQIQDIPQPEKIIFPNPEKIVFPRSFSFLEGNAILKQLTILEKAILSIPGSIPRSSQQKIDFIDVIESINALGDLIIANKPSSVKFPDAINVKNFPPQHVPTPVTNININPLRGFIKTTVTTVESTLTTLPNYGVLRNRRSIHVYNNSTQDLYVGGSDVTTVNGMIVPPNSYSPTIDAGTKMIMYGIVASGTSNVRVLEASNDSVGG